MKLFEELMERGVIKQITHPELKDKLNHEEVTFYCGFDPSSDSLHVGSLLPLVTMLRLIKANHKAIALLGGCTGKIGDPSFKATERKLLTDEEINKNLLGIEKCIKTILPENTVIVNNNDWFKELSVVDFLRDIGKAFTVNYMLAKESVRSRIEDRDQGISFTEFSYMLIQAQDFRHLHSNQGCCLQIGGSDQWGNIISGLDLIKKTSVDPSIVEVFGLTHPLVTKADGQKFGKSESGTIWMDAKKTTPFDFYQFFLSTDDRDVIQFLKWFTFLTLDEIETLEFKLKSSPEKREAHKALAKELTKMVHGEEELKKAEVQTSKLFEKKDWSSAVVDLELNENDVLGVSLADLLVMTKLSSSKSAARRDISGGGIKIGETKISDPQTKVDLTHLATGRLIIRKGKSSHKIIKVLGS